ncbi:MAG TPA: hypothetical protein PLZ37_12260, partial [Nitrospira sp.]|nr:hypothetical protein [Nitrospira sp.]
IVPMFTWGFRRSNFAFAMIHSFSQNTVFQNPNGIRQALTRTDSNLASTTRSWSPRRESNA